MGADGWSEPDAGVLAVLRRAGAFAVIPHVLPDVDALGSAEALCRLLRAAGKAAWVFAPEVPELYRWALDASLCAAGEPGPGLVRVAIDTARADRLQVPGPVAVNLDHHEDNPRFGAEADWVEVAPSCSCLLPPLAEAMGVPVAGALADAIYRGLVGDTECFRVNTGPEAFRWAAWLTERGADAEGTAERFWRRSPGFWGYLAAVEGLAVELGAPAPPGGQGAALQGPYALRVAPIPAELPRRFALRPFENALLPGHLSAPPRGGLAILQEGASGVRVRLRARGVDVLPLAHALGGGGHPQAAGVQMVGVGLSEALVRLRAAWMLEAGQPAESAPAPGDRFGPATMG